MAKKEEIKITALYERLSRDDEQAGESNSIHAIKFFGNIHLFHLKSSKKNFPAVMKHSYGSVKISLGGET